MFHYEGEIVLQIGQYQKGTQEKGEKKKKTNIESDQYKHGLHWNSIE
jgi:hypothetical protein